LKTETLTHSAFGKGHRIGRLAYACTGHEMNIFDCRKYTSIYTSCETVAIRCTEKGLFYPSENLFLFQIRVFLRGT